MVSLLSSNSIIYESMLNWETMTDFSIVIFSADYAERGLKSDFYESKSSL